MVLAELDEAVVQAARTHLGSIHRGALDRLDHVVEGEGGDGEEVGAVLKGDAVLPHEPQIDLVDQDGKPLGTEKVIGAMLERLAGRSVLR